MKNALFIIDAQNDFCLPTGSLSVPGAMDDMKRLSDFLKKNKRFIKNVSLTMDAHYVLDISHPSFWQDKNGNFPQPFTVITSKDVDNGVWTPRYMPQKAIKYIHDLEAKGEFPHVIWTEHCIMGTEGAAFVNILMDAVKEWQKDSLQFYNVFTKGTNPLTENFGIFEASVPIADDPSTQMNQNLIKALNMYDNIFFAGEAKSHCVATTLKQAMQFPDLAKKFIIMEDCMSNVPTFEHLADSIYDQARNMGIQFMKSVDINF